MIEKILAIPIPEHFYIINQKGTDHSEFIPALTKDKNDSNY